MILTGCGLDFCTLKVSMGIAHLLVQTMTRISIDNPVFTVQIMLLLLMLLCFLKQKHFWKHLWQPTFCPSQHVKIN